MLSCACAQPVPDSPQWLTYPGGDGPGKGKHIVLIAADQEYRSEQSMPMMAKILSTHRGFDCTVLFAVNEKGEVDPTKPVYPEKGKEFKQHHIPGLDHLALANLVIFFTRLLTLPMEERELIVKCIDSGKPIIALRKMTITLKESEFSGDLNERRVGDVEEAIEAATEQPALRSLAKSASAK